MITIKLTMSLIVDINKWVKKTLSTWLTFGLSVIGLACLLMSILPDSLGKRKDITNNNYKNNPKKHIQRQLQSQIEDTKIRLIFRTHADLADKLGVPQKDIILNKAMVKTWKDTSLECLEPIYGSPIVSVPQQMSIKGWFITWKYGNTMYGYNTSIKGDWVLCFKNDIPKDTRYSDYLKVG